MPITLTNPYNRRQYPGEVILLAVRWCISGIRTRTRRCLRFSPNEACS
jgi:hypothetical protein